MFQFVNVSRPSHSALTGRQRGRKGLACLSSIAVVATLFAFQIASPARAHAVPRHVAMNVVGDDTNDAYVGTGGLLLPSSFAGSGSLKRSVSSCLDCVWKYTVYCAADSEVMCGHAVTTCPTGTIRYRVWFGRGTGDLSVIGSVCWGSSKPATRRDLENHVKDLVIRYVPTLRMQCDPPDDTLTAIPIVCFTGQPTVFRPTAFHLSGRTVRITATPTWRWDWGDDSWEWHAVPGKPYPSHQIDHQYRTVGSFKVAVKTIWSAKYSVSGLGTYEVAGDSVIQHDHLVVTVHSARAIRAVTR